MRAPAPGLPGPVLSISPCTIRPLAETRTSSETALVLGSCDSRQSGGKPAPLRPEHTWLSCPERAGKAATTSSSQCRNLGSNSGATFEIRRLLGNPWGRETSAGRVGPARLPLFSPHCCFISWLVPAWWSRYAELPSGNPRMHVDAFLSPCGSGGGKGPMSPLHT